MTTSRLSILIHSRQLAAKFRHFATGMALVCLALASAIPGAAQTTPWNTNGSNIWYSPAGTNVGIGTSAPYFALDVAGGVIRAGNNLTMQSALQVQNNWQRGNVSYGLFWNTSAFNWTITDPTYNQASLQIDGNASLLFTAHSGALPSPQTDAQWHAYDRFIVRYDGNVGIGTVNPQYKLAVNGTIGTKEVIVTNTGWADYVFRPAYRLKPLSEVAAYIKENQHLPGIPSEAEVQEKGVSVGDMQVKLLAKIEELTLHMIQAEERNDRLEVKNRELQERLARLEGRSER